MKKYCCLWLFAKLVRSEWSWWASHILTASHPTPLSAVRIKTHLLWEKGGVAGKASLFQRTKTPICTLTALFVSRTLLICVPGTDTHHPSLSLQTELLDLSTVDVILISNYHCMMALPYITEHTGFTGTVYATEPTMQIGRWEWCGCQASSVAAVEWVIKRVLISFPGSGKSRLLSRHKNAHWRSLETGAPAVPVFILA